MEWITDEEETGEPRSRRDQSGGSSDRLAGLKVLVTEQAGSFHSFRHKLS